MFGKQSSLGMRRQSGVPLPDGVLVATLLNKTTGALQQHLAVERLGLCRLMHRYVRLSLSITDLDF